MNVENILRIAEAMETKIVDAEGLPIQFDMNSWAAVEYSWEDDVESEYQVCGSVACIAGHVVAVLDPESYLSYSRGNHQFSIHAAARDLLDIPTKLSRDLFTPASQFDSGMHVIVNPYQATPEQAAKVLRNLAKTGKVDWSVIKET